MTEQKPPWRQPLRRIRSNCGGCQKRHEAIQRKRRELSQALNRRFSRR